jgi:hypothetical protein
MEWTRDKAMHRAGWKNPGKEIEAHPRDVGDVPTLDMIRWMAIAYDERDRGGHLAKILILYP